MSRHAGIGRRVVLRARKDGDEGLKQLFESSGGARRWARRHEPEAYARIMGTAAPSPAPTPPAAPEPEPEPEPVSAPEEPSE